MHWFLAYLWGIETRRRTSQTRANLKSFLSLFEKENLLFWSSLNFGTVFSVPMRNWNQKEYDEYGADNLFLAYLWGIETTTNETRNQPEFSVFSVPMRNWNTACTQAWYNLYKVFSVPMRNWNDAIINSAGVNILGVFSVPMRNWNW